MRTEPLRLGYDTLWWKPTDRGTEGGGQLERWQRGRTGFPLVDAGMRELWATGRMQQNIRMTVASYLVEFCHISWVHGARWFEYTLADADLAINSQMWQQAGRTGFDQWEFTKSPAVGEASDPTGRYVHRWVPEMRRLDPPFCYRPWEAPPSVLEEAGVVLGTTYAARTVVDLEAARLTFMANVTAVRRSVVHRRIASSTEGCGDVTSREITARQRGAEAAGVAGAAGVRGEAAEAGEAAAMAAEEAVALGRRDVSVVFPHFGSVELGTQRELLKAPEAVKQPTKEGP